MSALGNYVHFHKINYKRYGTEKTNRKISISSDKINLIEPSTYYTESYLKQLMNEASYLEKEYNEMFYPKYKNSDNKTKTFRKNLESIIQKKLDKEFGSVAGTFNINTLSVDRNDLYAKLNDAIKETRNRLGTAKISKTTKASTLLKQIDLLYNILEQQEFKNIAEIQSRIEETKGKLNNIKNSLLEEIRLMGGNPNVQNTDDIETLKSIIEEFNRTPLLYKQNRAVFEWLVPYIQIQTNSIARKNLAKEMKTLASSTVKVDIDKEEEALETDLFIDLNEVEIKASTLKNNSEIKVTYKDSKNNIKSSNVIAKNIKTGSTEIQILNQTSLYQLLTLSNTYNFANHYLNLVTSSPGQSFPQAKIIESNRLLKSAIVNVGIKTYNSANFLVVNDYKKKKIYVYSIRLILYLIQSALLSGKDDRYANIVTLEDDYTIANDWEDTVEQRLGKVLIQTRNKKVHMTITPGMFNIYKKTLSSGNFYSY